MQDIRRANTAVVVEEGFVDRCNRKTKRAANVKKTVVVIVCK